MKQVVLKDGKVVVEEVPTPELLDSKSVLIKVVNSCISAGTEISTVKSAGEPLIRRAVKNPAKVKKALEIVKKDGIKTAYEKITNKLKQATPLGYSISGIVADVGRDVRNFKVGDAVAAAGVGWANHAEYVSVPNNLVVKIPNGLSFEQASTVALGAIAMNGVRRADLQIGELAVVFGAGILGLLSLQMLQLSGVRVAVVDINDKRLTIAKEIGAELTLNPLRDNVVEHVINWSSGYGVDAVLFTASTNSSDPLSQSFQMCRKKGRVILVGVSGMELKREDLYLKELDFLMSTSYGPGRYDKNYEEEGLDYPYGYVRWTENRNMQEYLRLVASGNINLDNLISAVYPVDKAQQAFESLQSNSEDRPIIVLLSYGKPEINNLRFTSDKKIFINSSTVNKEVINVALIGVGSFALGTHLPNLKKLSDKYKLYAVMSRDGLKSKTFGSLYGANYATTNYSQILEDKNIDLVLICTRHDSHAMLTLEALRAGKHVFVEKPLATNYEELNQIKKFYEEGTDNKPLLFVGFNRRFSRYLSEIKKHTERRINPLFIIYRVNAGYFPPDSWVHEAGGRIVGEVCHFIDTITYLTNSRIEKISFESLTPKNSAYLEDDNKAIILKYSDGSIGCIQYFATGNKELPKEYMEVHFDGKSIVLDDYKKLKGYGLKIKEIETSHSDKGHIEELITLYNSLKSSNKGWPIEFWDIIQTTEATLRIIDIGSR
ncbi:MAG: bi-domain-containing oxidoreductase [Thermodesulfovibrio sp.]|nr:bi-domain-containing oxidoreductase [Thermodesulfovibrio sp.]